MRIKESDLSTNILTLSEQRNSGSYLHYMFVHIVSNTVNLVGVIVGATIGGIVLFIALPIIICVIVMYCNAKSRRRVPTTYATTAVAAPTTSATVVATSQQSASAPAPAYPAGGYNYPKQVCMCVCICVCVCLKSSARIISDYAVDIK